MLAQSGLEGALRADKHRLAYDTLARAQTQQGNRGHGGNAAAWHKILGKVLCYALGDTINVVHDFLTLVEQGHQHHVLNGIQLVDVGRETCQLAHLFQCCH